ncbi:MAG: nucleotidyltransferase family protein [Schwartzia sp.]|nr:nucleotidyltransferase family protein [Schwartzia sp. (in: firmicutes)]
MHTSGLIAEYNPFHNGHRLQLNNIRAVLGSDTSIVVCMSGAFTQRGSAAVLPKGVRARCAVENGADLVIELPTVFAVRSAQYFAEGGVRLLASLGIIDTLAFGTECEDSSFSARIAEKLRLPETQQSLRDIMKQGHSYAEALTKALDLTAEEADEMRQPNNILAVEYQRALQTYAPEIKPLPLLRRGSGHHDSEISSEYPSASAIRRSISETGLTDAVRKAVPASVFSALEKEPCFPNDERLFRPLLAKLYTISPEVLANSIGINEGLENRIISAAKTAGSLEELCDSLSSRRYPKSRIRRTLLSLLFAPSSAEYRHFEESGPLYIRVLAFNERGRGLLKEIREKGSLPLVSRVRPFLRHSADEPDTPAQRMLYYDTVVSDLRGLTLEPIPSAGEDFLLSPAYVK